MTDQHPASAPVAPSESAPPAPPAPPEAPEAPDRAAADTVGTADESPSAQALQQAGVTLNGTLHPAEALELLDDRAHAPPARIAPPRIDDESLRRRYMPRTPTGEQVERMRLIRESVVGTAQRIRDCTPQSAEQTRAFNALDEVVAMSCAAIVRNE